MTARPPAQLLNESCRALAEGLETVAGVRCDADLAPAGAAPEADGVDWWHHDFGADGAAYSGCRSDRYADLLSATAAAGDPGLEELLSTAAGKLAVALSARTGRPVAAEGCGRSAQPDLDPRCVRLRCAGTGLTLDVLLAFDSTFLASFGQQAGGPEIGGRLQVPEPVGAIEILLSARVAPSTLSLQDLLRLRPGSVINLGSASEEPVEISVGGRVIARGRTSLSGQPRVLVVTTAEPVERGRFL